MVGRNSSLIKELYCKVKQYHINEERIPDEFYHKDVQNSVLIPKLRPYQVKAVRWMLTRELISCVVQVSSDGGVKVELPKGGILADEMGLGKTVELLACILENPLKDVDRLKMIWMDKVAQLPKAYECLVKTEADSKDEICVMQTIDISADHSYSDKKKNQTPVRNSRSCKRVSFKGLVDDDDDEGEDDKNFNLKEDDDDFDKKKERKRRKSDDEPFIGSTEKKKRRSSRKSSDLDDTDYSPTNEVSNKVVKRKSQSGIRTYLTNWYESMLQETTLSYREERKRALKFVPDLRCCCSDDILVNSEMDALTQIKCPSCDKFQHSQCLGVEGEFDLMNPYLCFQCWPKQSCLVPSGGTIIISPNAILNQWLTEIDKHIRKPGLNVLVYEGVRRNGYIQPTVLAQYDIVLTSYQVLIRELDYVDCSDGARSLRYAKRFHAPSSPLTSVLWWRLCLDEAQMIECTTTKVTSMVKNLTAVNKWAVCGTPIQKSIHDLYGLFCFLQVNPYNELTAWSRLLKSKDIMFELIPYIMWRMSKADVINEIGVPPQTVLLHLLRFSPVESHFYQKQHTDCSKQFMEKWAAFDDLNILLDKLDRRSTNKLLAPLLRLRQACVHPQLVRGQFVALKKTMTMDELLKFMVLKAVVDCEGALRLVIASLNGIAALLIILDYVEDAVDHYRQVLHLIQEYDGRLKVDSLQKIHTLHNLAEILDFVKPNVPRTLRDETLRQDTAELENTYMDKRKGDMGGTKQTLETFSKNIRKQSEGKPLNSSNWWANVLSHVQEPEEFINRLKIDLESSKTKGVSLLSKLSSRYALIEELRQWLGHIESNRKKVITTLDQLEKIKQEELAEAALACHLKQKNKKQLGEKRCLLCKCETYLKSYESNLFSITNTSMPSDDLDCSTSGACDEDFDSMLDETVDEPNEEENRIVADLKDKTMFETYNAGSWQASQQERALRMLMSYARSKHCEKLWLNEGQKHLQVLDIVKKEFRSLRLLWTQMFDYVAARDELSMAKVRLRLPYPGEKIKKKEEKKEIHIIAPHQVEIELARLKSEKATAEVDLKKKLGTLLYLQNLQNRENKEGDQIELCPICHNQLKDKWAVLSCGHYLCFDCVPALLDMCGGTHLVCAVCRERTDSCDVSYIEGEYDKGPDFLPVKGSHTTKIQAVVSELLKLRNKEPHVKVLIFSTWDRVLDLLSEAFSLNEISYRRLADNSVKKKNLAVSEFKNDNITALLLPIRHGAKGLNLIEATHVFLVEPLLNPADELQAVGRVHRIGQTRETFVHRFIVRDTIEERMLSVIDGNGQDEWNKENLTVGRLVNLFSVDGNVKGVTSETKLTESHGVCQISESGNKSDVTSENVSLSPVTPNQARENDVPKEISLVNIPISFLHKSDKEKLKNSFVPSSSSGEPSNSSDCINNSAGCLPSDNI